MSILSSEKYNHLVNHVMNHPLLAHIPTIAYSRFIKEHIEKTCKGDGICKDYKSQESQSCHNSHFTNEIDDLLEAVQKFPKWEENILISSHCQLSNCTQRSFTLINNINYCYIHFPALKCKITDCIYCAIDDCDGFCLDHNQKENIVEFKTQ